MFYTITFVAADEDGEEFAHFSKQIELPCLPRIGDAVDFEKSRTKHGFEDNDWFRVIDVCFYPKKMDEAEIEIRIADDDESECVQLGRTKEETERGTKLLKGAGWTMEPC